LERNDSTQLVYYASALQDLHDVFAPHAGQIIVGKALFYHGCSQVFVQCGRKWGKTSFAIYACNRFSLTFPGSTCYYFAPFLKQAKEIIWANRSLQNFFPPEIKRKYGITENNSELRISFANGSFIKVEGADNYEAVAGFNPHFVVVDEIKDISPIFWETMEPNLVAHSAPVLFTGTPPDNFDNLYCKLAAECRNGAPKKMWFKMPSSKNPHISREFLEDKHTNLILRGDEHIWQREYLANIVIGGAKFIFPMMNEKFVKPYTELFDLYHKNPKHFERYVVFDPGIVGCFGVLIGLINTYTKEVYLMDEIYEKDQSKCTSKQIFINARKLWREIDPADSKWDKVYDYAATYFELEVNLEFDEAVMPCIKDLKSKENKLSSIKQAMLEGKIFISDRCVNLYWELSNYKKDDKGKIPKENDHLIDCLRYMLNANNYFSIEGHIPIVKTDRRGYPLTREDLRDKDEVDPFAKLTDEYYL
jgi:hypothetical protein